MSEVYILIRFIHFMAVILMFGMSMFAAMIAVDGFSTVLASYLKKALVISTLLTAVTTILWMALQAGLMGDGWIDAIDFSIWQIVLTTRFGLAWRWALLLSIIAVFALLIKSDLVRNWCLLILSVGLFAVHAVTGHTVMHAGALGVAHQLNQFIHLLSSAYWFGGLWPFLICLQFMRHKNKLAEGLNGNIIGSMIRFSRIGHVAVILVLLTGAINSLLLLPDWPFNFALTEYQSLLWLKITLVFGMLFIALINRYILVPKIKLAGRLDYLIINSWIELILGTMAIFAVAIFATYQPI